MSDNLPSNWLQEYPYEQSLDVLTGLARVHAEGAGADSEALVSLLAARNFGALCDYKPVYRENCSVDDLINLRQTLGFFQKFEPLKLGIDREAAAHEKFIATELACRTTNEFWRIGSSAKLKLPHYAASIIHAMQRKIAAVLGPVPTLSQLKLGFGPGANTTVKATASSPRFKLGARLACSSELAPSVSTLLAEVPQWSLLHTQEDSLHYGEDGIGEFVDTISTISVEIHMGKLTFVPKTAKTLRSIVVEPLLNSVAQKGIGTYLKRRLLDSGLDLSSQVRNQMLARVGSLDNSLATVDLSSASDTISKEVVAMLLPLDWYSFLSRFRTGKVRYHDQIIQLEKFSSMGNAFTFELESLIFWTCALSTCEVLGLSQKDVATFGDDIIVPSEATEVLYMVLQLLGFTVNGEKSFSDGPFRESCGTDWYHGFDIRPFYQRSLVSAETLFTLHNFYARRFEFAMCKEVLKWIHPSLQIYGPDGYGDGHLVGSYQVVRSKKMREAMWDGASFDTFTRRGRSIYRLLPGDAVLPAYSIYIDGDYPVAVDAPFSSAKTRWVLDDVMPSQARLVKNRAMFDKHYVVRGSAGYRRISIYTLSRSIFF